MMASQYLLFESTEYENYAGFLNEYVGSFKTLVAAKLHAQREDRDRDKLAEIAGVAEDGLVKVCEMWPRYPGVWKSSEEWELQ